jgi:hypothetical protein
MYVKNMTYKDFNDEERNEDFYFNLTKAEITEMELSTEGGLGATIERITKAKDTPAIIKIFKELILKSYGVKSPDGKRFIKSPELSEEFAQTNAYSDLFVALASDSKEAAAFVNGIMPADVKESVGQVAVIE